MSTARPLHVLHLTAGSDAGGLSRYIYDVSLAMHEQGHRITVAGEVMSAFQWVGFVVVWAALAVFTYDGVRHARRTRAGVPDEPGVDEVEAPV